MIPNSCYHSLFSLFVYVLGFFGFPKAFNTVPFDTRAVPSYFFFSVQSLLKCTVQYVNLRCVCCQSMQCFVRDPELRGSNKRTQLFNTNYNIFFKQLSGNKMNSHNLATVFGPNILHKSKGGEFQVETLERADDRQDIIDIVEDMIDNHRRLFEVRNMTLC